MSRNMFNPTLKTLLIPQHWHRRQGHVCVVNMFLKLCSFLSLMDSRFKVRSTCSRQQAQLFTISSVKRESWSNFRYFNFFGKYLLTSEYPKNAALPKSTPPSCWHCEREKTVLKNAFRFFGISHTKKYCQFSNITLDCWNCKIHNKQNLSN